MLLTLPTLVRFGVSGDRVEVVLPQIYVHALARPWRFAPQLAGVEHHGVAMLPLRARMMRVGIRKHEHPPIARDHASLASHISRQARMPGWIDIACAHAGAFRETSAPRLGRFVFNRSGTASRDRVCDQVRIDRRILLREQFRARRESVLDQQCLGSSDPSFVITRREVARRRYPLDRMPALVGTPLVANAYVRPSHAA